MTSRIETVLTGLLTAAALCVAGLAAYRYVAPPGEQSRPRAGYVDEWRELLPAARFVGGNPRAPVTIIEFSDFECPVCRAFHGVMKGVLARFPDHISHSFAHFPLPTHLSALRAARHAECAALSGKFREAVDSLYANQERLGATTWPWITSLIPTDQRGAFERCTEENATPPMVVQGVNAGRALGITGTPTILVNGWRYPGMPADSEFVRVVEDLVAGKRPYPEFPAAAVVSPREKGASN